MREIKFRGKSPLFGKWLYGDLVRTEHTNCICEKGSMEMDGHHIRQFADRPQFVNENTIGLYTGLKDKDGKEIYEGDILEVKVMLFGEQYGEPKIRKVIWQDMGLRIVNKYGDCVCDSPTTTCELEYTIIGNIYDNPELLK